MIRVMRLTPPRWYRLTLDQCFLANLYLDSLGGKELRVNTMSKFLDRLRDDNHRSRLKDDSLISDSPQAAIRGTAYDALVLEAHLRHSLVTVRSLGSRGLRVAALETFDGVPAFSSRWCQQAFVCPAEVGTPDYLTYLEQVLDCTGARVLIT